MTPITSPVWRANWRPGHPGRQESLWSVTHKFCSLNFVSGLAVLRHFSKEGQQAAMMRLSHRDHGPSFTEDLRFQGALDLDLMSACLGISGNWIPTATLDRFGSRHAMRRAAMPFLRFCPSCIERGFHATVFQLAEERFCPVHGDVLEDSCPKCGRRIPYSLPSAKCRPYACDCGRLLWWRIGEEQWPAPLENGAHAELLHQHASIRFDQQKRHGVSSTAALLWVREKGPSLGFWDRLVDDPKKTATVDAVIRRSWTSDFTSRLRPRQPPGSFYGVVPADDRQFKEQIFKLFRQIERSIFKGFPCSRRKRWLARTNTVRYFDEIGKMDWSREFLAYIVWKSYWLDSCWSSFARGREMERHIWWRPRESRIYWRFLQHARLLRPIGAFTSADEWSQLHFFSMVAFSTYRAALDLVNSVQLWCYSFRHNRCARLEKALIPLVMLEAVQGREKTFALRITVPVASKPVPFKLTAEERRINRQRKERLAFNRPPLRR